MRLNENHYQYLIISFFYALVFTLSRLLLPDVLIHDEAEQIIDSTNPWQLGFVEQGPLYAWLCKLSSYIFGANLFNITLVKYSLICVLLIAVFQLSKFFLDLEKSLLVLVSLSFCVTYIYDFNRDLTHSVLATAISAAALWVFFLLIEKQSLKEYLLFGVLCALGMLTKYNFALIPFAILLASFFSPNIRKVIYHPNFIWSIVIGLVALSPHLYWLWQGHFSTIEYAASRAAKLKEVNLISRLALKFYSTYLDIGVFALITIAAFKGLPRLQFKNHDGIKKDFLLISLFAFAPILLLHLVGVIHTLPAKWLSPMFFMLAICFFILVDPKQITTSVKRNYNLLACGSIIAVLMVTWIPHFYPNFIGAKRYTSYPFVEIYQQLASKCQSLKLNPAETLILTHFDDHFILANIRYQINKIHSPMKTNLFIKNKDYNYKHVIYIWDPLKRGEEIPSNFTRKYPKTHSIGILRAKFLFSKDTYTLNVALA